MHICSFPPIGVTQANDHVTGYPWGLVDVYDAKVPPSRFPVTGQIAGSEPLFQEADPHIAKLA